MRGLCGLYAGYTDYSRVIQIIVGLYASCVRVSGGSASACDPFHKITHTPYASDSTDCTQITQIAHRSCRLYASYAHPIEDGMDCTRVMRIIGWRWGQEGWDGDGDRRGGMEMGTGGVGCSRVRGRGGRGRLSLPPLLLPRPAPLFASPPPERSSLDPHERSPNLTPPPPR